MGGKKVSKSTLKGDSMNKFETSSETNENSRSETELSCIVCAEPLQVAALSPCNHTVCHVCAFRQRKLYGKDQCMMCRAETKKLIFTDDLKLQDFNEIPNSMLLPSFKGDLGIRYTSSTAKNITLALLDYTCPITSCEFHTRPFSNFKELNEHAKSCHNKFYCTICGNHNSSFPSELSLYTQSKLQLHIRQGDYKGFKGHPSCKFCRGATFYSDEELFIHLRGKHFKCHVCETIDPNDPQYFKDYEQLERHFKDAHFICNVNSCLEQKFVVFPDEFELQTHMIKEHPGLVDNRLNFGHQLSSTFNTSGKKTQKDTSEPKTSLATKKKRFEMRAKHYLNFNNELYQRFEQVNSQYTNHHIDAKTLQSLYNEIFKNGVNADISLLLYEFSELFPVNSEDRRDLVAINKGNMKSKHFEESFPELPGTDSRTNSILTTPVGTWMNNGQNSFKKNGVNKFPSLPATKTTTNAGAWGSVNSTKKPIARGISLNAPTNGYKIPGYAPVGAPSSKSMSLSSSASSSSSSLNSKKVNTVNAISLSSLNLSSAGWGAAPSSASTSSLKKNDVSMFPSLPKPKQKVIPRVNPITSGDSKWGSTSSLSSQNVTGGDGIDTFLDTGIPIKFKSSKKGKKK